MRVVIPDGAGQPASGKHEGGSRPAAPDPGSRGRAPEAAAAALGLAWFLALGGRAVLDPRDLSAVGAGDWAQHVLGWLSFRNAPWRLPLGALPDYAWPVGGSLAMTDANPWAAVLGKLLSPLLPADFQYLGLWLALCFALQGFWGARLVALASPHPAHRLLGGALFVLSPALAWRLGHDTLCAHFILLAGLHPLLAPAVDRGGVWRKGGGALLLAAVAAGVHPYLAVMSLTLGIALAVRLGRSGLVGARSAGLLVASLAGVTCGTLALFGYLPGPPTVVRGFGRFSADALTFVNPMGRARFFQGFALSADQSEGFAYLGAGVLAIAALALALLPWRGARFPGPLARATLFALLPCGFLALYALSGDVTVAGHRVANLYPFYKHFMNVTGPLRSSGRFAWPLGLLVTFAAVAAVVALLPRALATAALAAAVLLQVADVSPVREAGFFAPLPWTPSSPVWALAWGSYDTVALYPANIYGADVGCAGGGWAVDTWVRPAYLAYRGRMRLNSGYLARVRGAESETACAVWRRELSEGHVRERTLYVVEPTRRRELERVPGVVCATLDALLACVRAGPGDAFAEALRAGARAGR